MGCNIPSLCPIQSDSSLNKEEEENNEEHPITTLKNITSRSNIQDQPTADTHRQRPTMKRLNFQSLIFPPISSDRSNVSYHNSEVKDKVVALISSRHGKSFLILLKQINFSVKIIQKLDKKKSELNSSLNSLTSKESNLSFNSFKMNHQSKANDNCLSEKCSNLLKFKNLFYLPLISINGNIEANFEIGKTDTNFFFLSFGVMFDYYDSFFNFVINLFQNYGYNNYKDNMVHIASFASEIQKIKFNYYPERNTTSMSLYYMSEEFYSHSLGRGVMLEPNSNKIQKEFLSFIYSNESSLSLYEVGYKNISLSSNDCYSILAKNIVASPSLMTQYQRFINDYANNPQYQKRIVMFIISYCSNQGVVTCIGFTLKQVAKESTTQQNDTQIAEDNTNTSLLKLSAKIANVKYQNISVTPDSIAISFEYYYL